MTGPEHYREAERLIEGLTADTGAVYVEDGNEQIIALAQVHATLAQAAATALYTHEDGEGGGQPMRDYQGWMDAASAHPKTGAAK